MLRSSILLASLIELVLPFDCPIPMVDMETRALDPA
jgi:hypothetical protein